MKKLFAILFCVAILTAQITPVNTVHAAEDLELNIMNWEDYIDVGDPEEGTNPVVEEFVAYYKAKTGKTVKVNYSTQGTNENMYTELTVNPNHYDLVCPSEYMILKMMAEDMLEPLQRTNGLNVDVYDSGVSPYIKNLFKGLTVNGKVLYDYAACYMWGTMGYIYNPEMVDPEHVKHWSAVWMDEYKNKCTIKDSIRDSYVLAIGYAYQEELMQLANALEVKKQDYLNGNISKAQYENELSEYNKEITDIFNKVDEESLNRVGNALKNLTDKLYGFEVDSGKKDMAAGKILINFAWSGDAVYALDYAEDPAEVGNNTTELYYVVPDEGSNIFFDGWVMPKGANVALAQEFINYVQRPDIALRNMLYIGYTTSIATDEIFEYLIGEDGYAYGEEEVTAKDNKFFVNVENENGDIEEIEVFPVDLSYLFSRDENGGYVAYTEVIGRQFTTQYPDFETVSRCTVMRNFADDELDDLNLMWSDAKEGYSGTRGLYIAILITLILLLGFGLFIVIQRHGFSRHGIKGYKVIKKEEL